MRTPTSNFPLILESHPDDYKGYQFITLIRYNDENLLCIIDNVINKIVTGYVLDLCGPANISEEKLIDIAVHWWSTGLYKKHPFSITLSKFGFAADACKVLRTFPLDYISRIIGNLPEYKMTGTFKVRKRKRKAIPAGMEFIDKRLLYNI